MSELNVRNDTHWNDLAKSYDSVMGNVPQMHDLFAEIVSHIPAGSNRILDLGAGTGNLLSKVWEAHPNSLLFALDPAAAMIERLREKFVGKSEVTCILGSAHAIDLPNNSVDVVVSNYALHHLTHEEKKICAREIMRVLTPGGKFIYGDQHCRLLGGPDDIAWVADMFSLLADKAMYYLKTAGLERMLLQVELMPLFLRAEGEMPVPVEYWLKCLSEAGFPSSLVIEMDPPHLLNRVIVSVRPS